MGRKMTPCTLQEGKLHICSYEKENRRENLFVVTLNSSLKVIYIKTKIDGSQQNSKAAEKNKICAIVDISVLMESKVKFEVKI